NPLPVVTAQSVKTAVCIKQTNTVTANGASTYTWITPTSTLTGATVTVSSNIPAVLLYSVTGTSSLGCEAGSSIPLAVSPCTGLDKILISNEQFLVYPNPSNGEFSIRAENQSELKIIDQLGQLIK